MEQDVWLKNWLIKKKKNNSYMEQVVWLKNNSYMELLTWRWVKNRLSEVSYNISFWNM